VFFDLVIWRWVALVIDEPTTRSRDYWIKGRRRRVVVFDVHTHIFTTNVLA